MHVHGKLQDELNAKSCRRVRAGALQRYANGCQVLNSLLPFRCCRCREPRSQHVAGPAELKPEHKINIAKAMKRPLECKTADAAIGVKFGEGGTLIDAACPFAKLRWYATEVIMFFRPNQQG